MKRRTPLRPSTKPIRRSSVPTSRTPIPPRRKDPSKRRFAKHRCQPYLDDLKTQPCCITGKRRGEWIFPELGGNIGRFHYSGLATSCSTWGFQVTVDPAHLRERSLGGDDLYNALPLARHLHDEQHRIRWPRFAKKYAIDRHEIAREHTERFLALHPEWAGAHAGGTDL